MYDASTARLLLLAPLVPPHANVHPGVLFLAATNRIDVLDPALLRPGRLSRKVLVPLPDEAGRQEILGVHLRGVPLAEDEDKEDMVLRLARVSAGERVIWCAPAGRACT